MKLSRLSVGAALVVTLIYGGLLVSLLWFLHWSELPAVLLSARTLTAVRLSVTAATLATGLALGLALPAAYGLSRFDFVGKELTETLLELPMVISPAALGAILLIFFNNPVGTWVSTHILTFVFAFAGIVLAQFVTVLGVAVRLLKAAFDDVPVELETVARTLGASPARAFFTVTLPLSRNGLVAALVLVWAKALGEFGATLMVAGSMAMRTETLPIAIFMRLSTADIEGTVVLIALLATVGLTALAVVRRLLRSPRRA